MTSGWAACSRLTDYLSWVIPKRDTLTLPPRWQEKDEHGDSDDALLASCSRVIEGQGFTPCARTGASLDGRQLLECGSPPPLSLACLKCAKRQRTGALQELRHLGANEPRRFLDAAVLCRFDSTHDHRTRAHFETRVRPNAKRQRTAALQKLDGDARFVRRGETLSLNYATARRKKRIIESPCFITFTSCQRGGSV